MGSQSGLGLSGNILGRRWDLRGWWSQYACGEGDEIFLIREEHKQKLGGGVWLPVLNDSKETGGTGKGGMLRWLGDPPATWPRGGVHTTCTPQRGDWSSSDAQSLLGLSPSGTPPCPFSPFHIAEKLKLGTWPASLVATCDSVTRFWLMGHQQKWRVRFPGHAPERK